MKMSDQFVEQEKKPFVYQEDMREAQKPLWKITKEGYVSSCNKIGHGEWSYEPEVERLMEQCKANIGLTVPLLKYMT